MMSEIKRRMLTCLGRFCGKCDLSVGTVSEEHSCAMCHLLSNEKEGGVVVMPRQSGKSTKISNLAISAERCGYQVVVFYPHEEVKRYCYDRFFRDRIRRTVLISSHSTDATPHRLAELSPSLIFSDEVDDWVVAKLIRLLPKHKFVLGLRS